MDNDLITVFYLSIDFV